MAIIMKNYMKSLIQQQSPSLSSSNSSKIDLFDNLIILQDKVESGKDSLHDESITKSPSWEQQQQMQIHSYSMNCKHNNNNSKNNLVPPAPLSHTGIYRTLSDTSAEFLDKRKKLESEDSSYDSDYELSGMSKSHDDVSRTFSDTLASEFSEYVSLASSSSKSQQEEEGGCDEFSFSSDPDYNGKVEFALRLGYPESLLVKALRNLPVLHTDLEKPVPQEEITTLCKSTLGEENEKDSLLPIVIDGKGFSYVSIGSKRKELKISLYLFQDGGKNLLKPESPISDQHILNELEKERILAYTPSRQVGGRRRVVCHDDRYILNLASETGAIVVSNDNYRELLAEKPEYKEVISKRILMYSFVNDRFMPPDDPMGKNGPTLHAFLRGLSRNSDIHHSMPCPYGKKCTYGNKCKYYHAERGNLPQKSITDKLKEHSTLRISEVRARIHSRDSSPGDPLTRTLSVNMPPRIHEKQQLCRTQSNISSRIFDRSHTNNQLYASQQMPQQQNLLTTSPSSSTHHKVYNNYSVPPPPPRTPWQQQQSGSSSPRRHSTTSSPYKLDSNNAHLKLSRQLSLNPCYDPRLQRFLCPPPTSHQNVSRIASAPEFYIGGSNLGFGTSLTYVTPDTPTLLQKTVSDSVSVDSSEWNSGTSERINYGPIGSSRKNSCNVVSSRHKLFVHLKEIFSENQVLQAMSVLPDETDGQKNLRTYY
ncbi:ZC3H12 [Lepeophtheirus salmonis]|uniref:ZC3H12 n=1 Tax=Lepeophtheirus salmonis TaxID=72036 RepID=A0A7R8D378_LEPSM|nr:ZC3H12 [Lepeophtheirus salmonis]CAF3014292.1 ZC3H12 [Lepeophtheirus salmonis]